MKRHAVLLLAVLLVVPAFAAFGQAVCSANLKTFNPIFPEENDERIEMLLAGSCSTACRPQGTPRIEIHTDPVRGNTLTIHFAYPASGDACLTSAGGEWSDIFALPQIPAGNYELFVTWGPTRLYGIDRTRMIVDKPRIDVQPRFGTEGTEVVISRPRIGIQGTLHATFDGVPSPSVRKINNDQIAAIVPKLSGPGKVDVLVSEGMARNIFAYDIAPPPSEIVRVLFPIAFSGRGALGSDWRTENWIRNDGPVALPTDAGAPIPPGGRLMVPISSASRGLIVTVPRALLEGAAFSSRIRDVSRSLLDAGTELRVITEDMARDEIVIPNVKLEDHYRYTLRIYDIDSIGRQVSLQVMTPEGVEIGRPTSISLVTEGPNTPAYAAVELLNPSNASVVDLRISTLSSVPVRLWGFVSATNNDTQHVTTYSPDR